MKRTAAFPLLLALAAALQAQTAPPPLAFEVASIKPAAGDGPSRKVVRGGRLEFSNVSLKEVIAAAYKLEYFQITAPAWMDNVRFDIAARIPEAVPKEQTPAMLQTLLKDRFKLKAHVDTKKGGATYALVAAKGGPKLKPAAESDEQAPQRLPDGTPLPPGPGIVMKMDGPDTVRIKMRGVTLAGVSQYFSKTLLHPVVDETGTGGKYDIDLTVPVGMPDGWADPAGGAAAAAPPPPPGPPTLTPAAIAKALEGLGLKLETRRGPVEYLVVDSADRVPTVN